MNWKWIAPALAAGMLTLGLIAPSSAHVTSERTRYSDIIGSDARFDIMLLSAIGVTPNGPEFHPDDPMTKQDAAIWAALAARIGQHGETPDAAGLAQEALDAKLIDSLDGDASFADLSNVFFKGQVKADNPDATPTKGEAAQFIAAHLSDAVEGTPLLETWKAVEGPVGPITAIKTETTASGGTAYFITIGDTTAPNHAHIKISNGQTDLATWEGRTIRRSLLREEEGQTYWLYLEADADDPAAAEEKHEGGHGH